MALHTGEATERDVNYFGSAVDRAARADGCRIRGPVARVFSTAEVL